MRKIYLMLVVALLSVAGVQAQTAVTSLSQLSNTKAYTIQSARCFLQNYDNTFVTSTSTISGVATELDATKADQQFAILKGNNSYYLYSVGAASFVDKTGAYQTSVNEDCVLQDPVATGNADYPWLLKFDDSHILNTQTASAAASWFPNGYVLDDWSSQDEGNRMAIAEAADFASESALAAIASFESSSYVVVTKYNYILDNDTVYTYTTKYTGSGVSTISFDAPGSYLGVVCLSSQKEDVTVSKACTIVVNYLYEYNESAMPVDVTTIQDGAFAENTQWYFLAIRDKNRYMYYDPENASTTDASFVYVDAKESDSHPLNKASLFAFTGNPITGYKIFNMAVGTENSMNADTDDYGNVWFRTNGDTSASFQIEQNTSDKTQYQFLRGINGSNYSYVNYETSYGDGMMTYAWSTDGATDAGSMIYITPISETEADMLLNGKLEVTSITPASGKVQGEISEVNILFEQALTTISCESGMPTITDASGKAAATIKLEINEENEKQLDVKLTPALAIGGTYTLTIPSMTVRGGDDDYANAEMSLVYKPVEPFDTIRCSGICRHKPFEGYESYAAWKDLTFPADSVFAVDIVITAKNELTIKGFNGYDENINMILVDTTNNTITSIDGVLPDSYSTVWVISNNVTDYYASSGYTYYGFYAYPAYSYVSIQDETGYGCAAINMYSYRYSEYEYLYYEWNVNSEVGVNSVLAPKSTDNAYYSLNGYKMDGRNLKRGIYIKDGKKYLVK